MSNPYNSTQNQVFMSGSTKAYNNAFEILTDDPAKLKDYNDRSDLMDKILDHIHAKKWNEDQVCENLNISYADSDNLKFGRISELSLEFLTDTAASIVY